MATEIQALAPEETAPAPPIASARETLTNPLRLAVIAGLFLFVLFGLPALLDSYWMQVVTGVVIYSIMTLGLGLLIGRVGLVSLCQFVLAAIGAWVALRLSYATDLPFPALILIAGVVTGVIGTLIGLPALRLSGLHLALITLMAAGGITIILRIAQFPNGGGGFFGNSAAGGASSRLPRPSIATNDTAYYRLCLVVAALMFIIAVWQVRGKPGRAWAAIRQSQATAVAAGVNTVLYKLWAFALASFMAGIAGALLASATGGVNINQFPTSNSITLLAVVLMGGVYSIWGAVVAALLLRLLPALLDDWGVSTEFLTILFGIGVLQVLMTAPGGLVDQVPKDLAKLGRRIGGLFSRKADSGVIEVVDLYVRFGGVVPIDRMTITFPGGTCGLIGPNGAGKTTFFNVLSGFVRPAAGRILAFGDDLLSIPDFKRPRWGLRRTFQTEQAIANLSVYQNVLLVHEHTGGSRSDRREDVMRAVSFVGLEAEAHRLVGGLGAGQRRLVEVARAVVGNPRVVLLDEPAAGLPDEETAHLGELVRRIPTETGGLVILVDHDMSLVSACCETTAVLDFGRLIASGETAKVLRDEQVIRAYLGTEEVA